MCYSGSFFKVNEVLEEEGNYEGFGRLSPRPIKDEHFLTDAFLLITKHPDQEYGAMFLLFLRFDLDAEPDTGNVIPK